jgi:hypothetical protein
MYFRIAPESDEEWSSEDEDEDEEDDDWWCQGCQLKINKWMNEWKN